MGGSVHAELNNWTVLNRYCEDGDLEIDNNRTERSIHGVAVGRNNWIFFGSASDQGGHTAALLRSFVASCQRVGVDPYAWFSWSTTVRIAIRSSPPSGQGHGRATAQSVRNGSGLSTCLYPRIPATISPIISGLPRVLGKS